MGFIQLTGPDNGELFKCLERAFDHDSLKAMVLISVPEIAGAIAPGGISQMVVQVVGSANQHGVLDKFLVAASNARPHRPDLRALVLTLSQRPGWATPYVRHEMPIEGLERLTSKGNPFLDGSRLALWMIQVERQVCQVRCGPEAGTGFLIAPDLVMTNHHVVAGHLKGGVKASDVAVRFDYRVSADGVAPDPDADTWEPIDATWQIPSRPHSKADVGGPGDPAPTELDYAILKLSRRVGDEPVLGGSRGWVDLSKDEPLPAVEAPILIVQHPGQPPVGTLPQQPLKIAFATPGFDAPNANGTRVVYRPSTLKGSSGSPVFGPKLRAVALHHNRGQLAGDGSGLDKDNRGIPLSAIRADLGSRGDLPVDVLAMLVAPPKLVIPGM